MKYTQNSINILSALQYKGIGIAWIVSNWRKGLTDAQIVEMINQSTQGESTSEYEFGLIRQNIMQHMAEQTDFIDGVIGWLDEDYPYCRGNIRKSDYPVALFYKGDIQLLSAGYNNVAVIGVLNPEETIIQREKMMVSSLLKHNYVIVSGLAHGCDSIAHKQTLAEGGRTIAILPSTLSHILPTQHRDLALQIVRQGGLLITEYMEEPKSQLEMRGRYQKRDRLQAIFSDAIILTASYDVNNEGNDCGSRLAMEYARQYRIPRYVMYNEITDSSNPQFALNRRVLHEGETMVITQSKISKLSQNQTSKLELF